MKSRDITCSDPIAYVTGKPPIHERPLLTPDQATEVVTLFQALANDSRLRMLHALARAEELCVTDLAAAMEMTPQAISNQLRRLIDRRIVATRREGNHIYYRIIDPCVHCARYGHGGHQWIISNERTTTIHCAVGANIVPTFDGFRRLPPSQ